MMKKLAGDPGEFDVFESGGDGQVLTCRCGCAHVLRAEDDARQVQCSRCGEVLRLAPGAEAFDPLPLVGAAEDVERALEAKLSPRRPGALLTNIEARFGDGPPDAQNPADEEAISQVRAVRRGALLRRELFWSLLFFTNASGVRTLVFLWLLMSLELIAVLASMNTGFFLYKAAVVMLILSIEGVMSGVMLSVVDAANDGGDELPPVGTFDDLIADWPQRVLTPLLTLGVTWVYAIGPAFLVFSVGWATTPAGALPSLPTCLAAGGLLLIGLFFWPILVLIGVHAEMTDFFRPDLMIRSILNAFGGYLMTVVFMLGLVALMVGAVIGVAFLPGALRPTGVLLALLLGLIRVLGQIPVFRAIGVFGRVYRDQVAWDWT